MSKDKVADRVTPPGTKPAMFTVKKQVTRPTLQMKADVPIFVVFQGEIYKGKEITATKPAGAAQPEPQIKPADIANVVNLETGELAQIVVGEVLKGVLLEEYKDGSYVGLGFRICKRDVTGKRYKQYDVAELELSDEAKALVKKAA